MFKNPKADKINDWVCVMERNTDIEVEMARSYLANLQIPSNILSKKDSAYSLNVGHMALVYLYVPEEFEQEAREALGEWESNLE